MWRVIENPQFSVSRIVRRTESVAILSCSYADPAVPASRKPSIRYKKRNSNSNIRIRNRNTLRTGTLLDILFDSLDLFSSIAHAGLVVFIVYVERELFRSEQGETINSQIFYLRIPLMEKYAAWP